MSYKILINGRNAVFVSDLIRHMSKDCIPFSTSDVWADIMVHMKYMQPDAYITLCPKGDDKEEALNQLVKLSRSEMCKEMAFVVICDPDDIGDVEENDKKAPDFKSLKITRPTSAKEIESRTVEYIKALIRKRVEEEKKQQEKEWAARAHQEELKALEEAKKRKKEEEKARIAEAKEKSIAALLSDSGSSAPSNDPGVRKHILIVDDDRNVLKLLKTALSEKYEVTAMLNGKMAEKFLETKTADLILLDHEMPVETGLEVFQKIKENKGQSNIPVIFLTGTTDTNKIKEILALHPKGYLLKPVDVDKLLTAISDALK